MKCWILWFLRIFFDPAKLSAKTRSAINAHISTCPKCAERYNPAGELSAHLKAEVEEKTSKYLAKKFSLSFDEKLRRVRVSREPLQLLTPQVAFGALVAIILIASALYLQFYISETPTETRITEVQKEKFKKDFVRVRYATIKGREAEVTLFDLAEENIVFIWIGEQENDVHSL